jgi:hypothetical protein
MAAAKKTTTTTFPPLNNCWKPRYRRRAWWRLTLAPATECEELGRELQRKQTAVPSTAADQHQVIT